MSDLKACPFCGHAHPQLEHSPEVGVIETKIFCAACGICIEYDIQYNDEEAVELWNERPGAEKLARERDEARQAATETQTQLERVCQELRELRKTAELPVVETIRHGHDCDNCKHDIPGTVMCQLGEGRCRFEPVEQSDFDGVGAARR